MGEIWTSFTNIFASAIEVLHNLIAQVPFLESGAWGWAIIALTLIVRILLLPLAAKQFTSMRKMQEIQPRAKKIQEKYKVDRSLMKSDPEKYREMSAKKNEKLQELYREEGVNPAAGCLPLLAQGPIFFALFRVLRTPPPSIAALSDADFYFFTPGPEGLGETASAAGIAGIALLVMVAGSMFVSQKQMMSRNTMGQGDMQATQQKVMLYAMPVMMGVFGFNLPIGVLLYWVTTNVWTMGQQWFITRRVAEETGSVVPATASPGRARAVDATGSTDSSAGTAGNTRRATRATDPTDDAPSRGSKNGRPSSNGSGPAPADGDTGSRRSRLPGRSRRRDT